MYTETLTYLQIKRELDRWCDEDGCPVRPSDDMHYPFQPDCKMSLMQVMWRLHSEGRVNTMRGLRYYFDRYVSVKNLSTRCQ